MRRSRQAGAGGAAGAVLRIPLSRVWALAAILAPTVGLTRAKLGTVDLAYHLRAGATMLRSGSLLRVDAFTFTAAGRPWLDQQWGAQILFEALFRSGGWLGLAAARSILAGAVLLLVFLACRAQGAATRPAAWLTFGAALLLMTGLQLRPQLLGIACFAATQWLVSDRHRHPRRLWLVVPIAVVWANVHGSFFFAPVLVGIGWLADLRARNSGAARTLLRLGALAAIAPAANPAGLRVWSYVVDLATDPLVRSSVVEWQPPTIGSYTGAAFFASAAVVAVLLAAAPERPSWPAMLALGLFFAVGLTSLRGVLWWGLVAPVTLAGTSAVPGRGSRHTDPTNAANGLIAIGLVVATIAALARWFPYRSPAAVPRGLLSEAPAGITDELRRELAPGERLFNAQIWGSWFELALPQNPVAVDSRIEVIPEEVWRAYDDVSEGREGWQRVLERWGVRVVVVSPQQQRGLLPRIQADPAWELVYRDGDGAIFRRVDRPV